MGAVNESSERDSNALKMDAASMVLLLFREPHVPVMSPC